MKTTVRDYEGDLILVIDHQNPTKDTHRAIVKSSNGQPIYIADEDFNPVKMADVHICRSSEYDSSTGTPTISSPDPDTFYLVPDGTDDPNLFTEWIYVNDSWEVFGSATIDVPKNIKDGTGVGSIAEGDVKSNSASARYAHAEGTYTVSSGMSSHAEGDHAKATANQAHAEGNMTTASFNNAHAEGYSTTASNVSAHAEGSYSVASGIYSHAEGYYSTASGSQSHAEGYNTIANHSSQHVFGEYNLEDTSQTGSGHRGTYIEIVGNGDAEERSNARTLDWSGNEKIGGSLTLGLGTEDEVTITPAQLYALLNLLN